MKDKKVIITSVVVLLIAIIGVFSYNTFLKEKPVEGSKKITVNVINAEANYKKEHVYTTEADSLGDALDAEGLIEYDKSEMGRFVHTIDNIKADSDKQQWWSVVVNGKDAETGIDDIMIKDGDNIELVLKTGW